MLLKPGSYELTPHGRYLALEPELGLTELGAPERKIRIDVAAGEVVRVLLERY